MKRRYGSELVVLALAVTLAACSASPEKDYRAIYASQENVEDRPLEVPPELGRPLTGEQMRIPAIGREQASYSGQQGGQGPGGEPVVATAEQARFVRDGDMHWLELELAPEQVWTEARKFMESLGFEITRADRQLGILETDWQERRERVPGNWLVRMLDTLGSSGYQDRYRVRLERLAQGGTRLFISHRGLEETVVAGGGTEVIETAWVPQTPDPGLEVELLQRFLIALGAREEQAGRVVASGEPVKRTRFSEAQGEPLLQVTESFPRTWRRVGLALDRVGLLVEDRNRSEGVYFIKLTDEFKDKEKKGFWASLLGDEDPSQDVDKLLLIVRQQGNTTGILVRDRNNGRPDAALARRLLEEMEVHLR